ncbi:MAG: MerR family transcriptional regulator [Chloroflexi bacterium]|nr:MAG: MerR family transcriptional regulator [Chloroflexota bacterium]
MRVGELATRSGIPSSTLRYYEKLGLVPRVSRNKSGYREYPKETLDQLVLIGRAKELGFSLREVRALLTRPRGTTREAVLAAVASKLSELEGERRSLGTKERRLRSFRGRVMRDGDIKADGISGWLLRPDKQESTMGLGRSSLGHFDEHAFKVINIASGEAHKHGDNWIGSEHLMLAFAQMDHEPIRKLFESEGVELHKIRKAFEKIDFGTKSDEPGIFITHRVQRIFGIAEGIALRDERRATAEDLLLAILEDGGGVALHLIRESGGDPAGIAAALREKLG